MRKQDPQREYQVLKKPSLTLVDLRKGAIAEGNLGMMMSGENAVPVVSTEGGQRVWKN